MFVVDEQCLGIDNIIVAFHTTNKIAIDESSATNRLDFFQTQHQKNYTTFNNK